MVMHLEDPSVKTKVIGREVKIYQGRKIPGLVLKERQSRKFSSLGLYVHRDYALKRFNVQFDRFTVWKQFRTSIHHTEWLIQNTYAQRIKFRRGTK